MSTPGPVVGDELLASENRLRLLLACTKGIVFEFDRDARYLYVWTHDEALLARPTPEMIGRTIDEVLGDAGRPFTEAVRRVYATGKSETIEYDLAVQGGRRWFTADVTLSPAVAGRDRTVVYLVRDVTAHKQLEDQLRQAQKMEAIGRLAGGIAHDFNNILTTIIGYSDLLLAGLGTSSAHHKRAARVRHAAERAAALTSQLLAYGRKRVLVTEVLDVNAVISSMVHMLRRLIGAHIELRLELDSGVGGAKADLSGLEQVIMNLSLNARDALVDGGRLTLRTANVELDEAYCANQLEVAPGSYVLIQATDDGQGMDAATQTRIFEPFFTTKEVGKGTGLGLSTVYGIVKQSGGHIEVDSAPGRGASFRVYLPRVALPAQKSPAITVTRPSMTSGQTVLVVEDDADARQLMHDYLTQSGYDVVLAADAMHALDVARARSIDLVVTDIVMPKLGGDELAKRLRKLQPGVRVLYVSGYPDGGQRGRVPPVANSRFLQKPFTRQALVEEVGALLRARAPRSRRSATSSTSRALPTSQTRRRSGRSARERGAPEPVRPTTRRRRSSS